jgi:hypothetical protein
MAADPTRSDAPLKTEGDKLSNAVGGERQPASSENTPRPSDGSLKTEGDKLQNTVDNALDDGGAR